MHCTPDVHWFADPLDMPDLLAIYGTFAHEGRPDPLSEPTVLLSVFTAVRPIHTVKHEQMANFGPN